jgi:hypothetical protein
MRGFSLLGLLVFVLWVATMEWVAARWGVWDEIVTPWKLAPTEARTWPWHEVTKHYWDDRTQSFIPCFKAYTFEPEAPWGFASRYQYTESDDELLAIYRLAYPPYWWGHFYRPEVWLAIIFGSLWLWRVVGWFRERRQTRATVVPPKNAIGEGKEGTGGTTGGGT